MEMKKRMQEWNIWAYQQRKQICFYGEKVLDLFKCLSFELLLSTDIREFSSKDITECLKKESFARRKAIEKITNLCIVGYIISSQKNTVQSSSTPTKGSKNKKKVCFGKSIKVDEAKKKLETSVDTNTTKASIKHNKQNNLTSFQDNRLSQKKSALRKKPVSLSDTESHLSQASKSHSSQLFQTKYEQLENKDDNLEFDEEIITRKIPVLQTNNKRND